MIPHRSFATIAVAIVLVLFSLARLAAVSAAEEEKGTTSRVPVPDIAEGRGEFCVEDTEFMRRNHMRLLMHQRDDTMLEGIRGGKHSLKECIDCHAVEGPDAIAVTVSSPKHFCRSCHDYAAVQIDCFDCHASRPEPDAIPADHDAAVARAGRE